MTRAEFIQRAVIARFGTVDGRLTGDRQDDFEEFCDMTISRAEALADKLQDGGEAPWSASDATGEESVGERLVGALHGIGTADAPLFVRQDPPVPMDHLGLRTPHEAATASNYVNDAQAIVEIELALARKLEEREIRTKTGQDKILSPAVVTLASVRRIMESHAARRK